MVGHAHQSHDALFVEAGDFNEQLYRALRNSPWWMISIAAHVLLVVISTMFAVPEAAPEGRDAFLVTNPQSPDAPPDDELRPDPDNEIENTYAQDFDVKEVVLKDAPISDHAEDDVDMPFEERYGESDGKSDSSFEGPSNNDLIGIGNGPGSRGFGKGGMKNLRTDGRRRGQKDNDALEDALRWLAAHQSPEGQWEAEGFGRWCDRKPAAGPGPEGKGKAQYDVGVTGLSLLAFLGAGYTNRSEPPFGKVVGDGLRWLKNQQDAEGCFGPRSSGHFVYNHAIAALAMVEAYGMTGSAIYRNPAQKALDFIALTRNPYFAWRYGVKPGDNDTSVTGWMMMALKSARLVNESEAKAGRPAPLLIDVDAFEGIRAWIEKMTDAETGRVGYQLRGSGPARPNDLVDRFPQEKSESMTAVGVLARAFLGENPKESPAILKGAALCSKLLPTWNPNDGSIDMYYWYYATLGLWQVGGETWSRWEKAMKTSIVETQRKDGDFCMYRGSWDPIDAWGQDGGRVYSTAILALCLEVWFRYPRVFGASRD